MNRLNSKKGFTLVELLAVIVVLAIIMIIAVPNVLESMNTARKQSFINYARKLLNQAQLQYQADELISTPRYHLANSRGAGLTTGAIICYDLNDLGIDGGGKYSGSVSYDKSTGEFRVHLKGDGYMIVQDSSKNATSNGSSLRNPGLLNEELNVDENIINYNKSTVAYNCNCGHSRYYEFGTAINVAGVAMGQEC